MGEERPWEKCYPPGVRWDVPIQRAPLPLLFDAFNETWDPGAPKEPRTFLGDKLGRHALPAHLEFRDALPKTAVGKLSRKELIEEERQKRKTQAIAELRRHA